MNRTTKKEVVVELQRSEERAAEKRAYEDLKAAGFTGTIEQFRLYQQYGPDFERLAEMQAAEKLLESKEARRAADEAAMDLASPVESITGFWRNKKRGNVYRVLQDGLVNTTNAQDGETMVMYVAIADTADAPFTFVRKRAEFLAKFEAVWFEHTSQRWVRR